MTAVTLIGFGEAGRAFASAEDWRAATRAYDRLTDLPATRAAKLDDYRAAGVSGALELADAVDGARLILSLVTADQAVIAAHETAERLSPGALYCDLNSVAPGTKRAAAAAIEAAGGRYVDVAVMAPVHPARLRAPLLVSGPHSGEAVDRLAALGFSNVRVVAGQVGQACAVKMIRSVVVKGLEALTAEAMLAAYAAGVAADVLDSLDASERAMPWSQRAEYNLDRMLVHGRRRADEMEEVGRTLEELGVEPIMARATERRQREFGRLGLSRPPAGLAEKLAAATGGRAAA